MYQVEWGNRFGRSLLRTSCSDCFRIARAVLGPWGAGSETRVFGPWAILREGESWRVEHPPEMSPYLGQLVEKDRYPGCDEAVKAVEFQAVGMQILAPGGPLGFHGALLAKNSCGIALVGMKESGKSTLAAALREAGLSLYSDDGFQVEECVAYPMARRARLRKESRSLLPRFWEEREAEVQVQADGGLLYRPDPAPGNGVELKVVVLLQSEEQRLNQIKESDFVLSSVVHSHTYHSEGLPQALSRLSVFSNRVRAYRMGRGPLPEQVAAILEVL